MYEVYSWSTSNGRKVHIMLEELGVEYRMNPIEISKGDQFSQEYTAINPNQKIPAIIDPNGPDGEKITLFESGAILMYLGEKHGQFFPESPRDRYETIQWLMFQMGGIGPIFGQAHHFRRASGEKVPYAISRYTKETRRLWGVLDRRLEGRDWVAAGQYTIADIAIFPWCARYEWQGVQLDEFPNVQRWYNQIDSRAAVQKGMEPMKATSN
jgi:GST-like protein